MNDQEKTNSVNMVSDPSLNGTKDLPPVNMVKLGSSYLIPSQVLTEDSSESFPTLNGASILKTALNNSRGSSPQSTSSGSSTLETTNFVNITNGSHVNGDLKLTLNGTKEIPASRRSSVSSVSSTEGDVFGTPNPKKRKVMDATATATTTSTHLVNLTNNLPVNGDQKQLTLSRRSSASSLSSLDVDLSGPPNSKKLKMMVPASPDVMPNSPVLSSSTPDNTEKVDRRKRCGCCSACQVLPCGKCYKCFNNMEKYCPKRPKCQAKLQLNTTANVLASKSGLKLIVPAAQSVTNSPNSSAPGTPTNNSSPITTPNYGDKRKRCGICMACQMPKCGTCKQCIKDTGSCLKLPKCERRSQHNAGCTSEVGSPKPTPPAPKRKRCKTCPGCLAPPCGNCAICRKKEAMEAKGEKLGYGICRERKCHAMISQDSPLNTSGTFPTTPIFPVFPMNNGSILSSQQYNLTSTPEWLSSTNSKLSPRRKRCNTCTGCLTPPCEVCSICVKKASCKANGERVPPGLCHKRKCLTLASQDIVHSGAPPSPIKNIKIKQTRCGICEGCSAKPCGSCGHCNTNPLKCFARRCKAPIREARTISPEKSMRCGACFGCSALECGSCAYCLKKAESGGEVVSGICDKKICKKMLTMASKKEVKPIKPFKPVKPMKKRCGKCEGCSAEPCGNCKVCAGKYPAKCPQRRCKDLVELSSKGKTKKACGICPGCTAEECGECSYCTEKASLEPGAQMKSGTCIKRKCENTSTEKKLKPAKKTKGPKPKVMSSKQVQRTARCGECSACVAPDCGECTSCKINAEFGESSLGKTPCLTNKCMKPIAVYGDGGRPSVAPVEKYVPPILCEFCPGCATECGKCPGCLGNPKFGGNDDPPEKCHDRICHNVKQKRKPTKATSNKPLMLKMMALQDDSAGGTTMPTRVVNGILYDFRCFFCKALPRAGSANRSELMRHYAVYHYAKEIKAEFGNLKKCPHCNADFRGSYVSHMGQKHNEVVKYLPEEARKLCPVEIQGKSHNRRPRRMAVVKKRRRFGGALVWPDLPDGFHPSAENRLYDPTIADEPLKGDVIMKEITVIRINDKIIEEWIEDDKEHIELTDDKPVTDFTGVQGQCMACNVLVDEVTRLVLHLHEDHEIEGGSSHTMKDAEAFIEKGFIRLNKNDDKESNMVNKVSKKEELKNISPLSVVNKSTSQTARKSSAKPPSLNEEENPSPEPSISNSQAAMKLTSISPVSDLIEKDQEVNNSNPSADNEIITFGD